MLIEVGAMPTWQRRRCSPGGRDTHVAEAAGYRLLDRLLKEKEVHCGDAEIAEVASWSGNPSRSSA